jgi:hypothetical protein
MRPRPVLFALFAFGAVFLIGLMYGLGSGHSVSKSLFAAFLGSVAVTVFLIFRVIRRE